MGLHVIVLAAGKGKRMRSELAKVLHEAAGRPLIAWVLEAVAPLRPDTNVVVVGHQADLVTALLPDDVRVAHQASQLGTGDAARVGLTHVEADPADTILVVPGDMPLIRADTLRRLLEAHETGVAVATVLTCRAVDRTGYGRIVREAGDVVRIVEEGDATEGERAVDEINTSVYAFTAGSLGPALEAIGRDNAQGELYLTDVIGVLAGGGGRVAAVGAAPVEGMGVNTSAELESVTLALTERAATAAEVSHRASDTGYPARGREQRERD